MVLWKSRLEDPVSFPRYDHQWHSFLQGEFDIALKIKRFVDDLPESRATFKLRDIDLGVHRANIDNRTVKLTGAWEMPDELAGNSNIQKWVNPNYVHSQHYSDAVVRCECGIPVLREHFSPDEPQPGYHQEHEPDCDKIKRAKTRLRLLQNRKRIIEEAYYLGQSLNEVVPRLGYSSSRQPGSKTVDDLGLDFKELSIEGRKRLARTFMVLSREYTTREIGELYGISSDSVARMLTKETKTDAATMYKARRKMEALE